MSVLVNDTGFVSDDYAGSYATPDSPAANATALDLGSDTTDLPQALSQFDLIRVDFPSFADGRGFSIARSLRRAGFTGRLRARGHVLSDQYAMARRAGFDEVEIDEALAARQPEEEWIARADWKAHNYQARLRG